MEEILDLYAPKFADLPLAFFDFPKCDRSPPSAYFYTVTVTVKILALREAQNFEKERILRCASE